MDKVSAITAAVIFTGCESAQEADTLEALATI
jgi:hypothetical protein